MGERGVTMIIGSGSFQYEVHHNWAKLPEGKEFGYTHGVVEDKAGRIFIANMSRDAIMIFDVDGNFRHAWGEEYEKGAHGLTLSEEDGTEYLYLANTELNHVIKTTLKGEVIWKIEQPPRSDIYDGSKKKFIPTETAVGPNNHVYIADGYGQFWIHIYTTRGDYISSFGGYGEEPGKFKNPHGISIDVRGERPYVQIANRHNARIDNFTLEGNFVETIISPDTIRFPCTTKHADGRLYVPDLLCRISIYDTNNQLIIHLGDYLPGENFTEEDLVSDPPRYPDLKGYPNIPPDKYKEGKFVAPHDLHVDSQGNIYVVEWQKKGRVTKLKRVCT
jgi:hypothetical protein